MATQVILLQRMENLGNIGDVVAVRPGYARNYLLPQKKALRASKDNIAYFEAQKKFLLAENDKKKAEAQKQAQKLEGLKVAIIRQASEDGQMFGSVTSRDIAAEGTKISGITIERSMVQLNQNLKLIGLYPVEIVLHPEVKVSVTINIARSDDEAEVQAKTGRALVAAAEGEKARNAAAASADEAALEGLLEDGALQTQKQKKAEAQSEADEEAAGEEARAAKRAKKAAKPKKAEASQDDEDDAEESEDD